VQELQVKVMLAVRAEMEPLFGKVAEEVALVFLE
jgi:hypothetical protein